MTILKLSSRGGVISAIRAGAVTLVLVAGFMLAGCAGVKSSPPDVVTQEPVNIITVKSGNAESAIPVVVAQEPVNPMPVKSDNAKSALLADLHGTVEVKTGDGQWNSISTQSNAHKRAANPHRSVVERNTGLLRWEPDVSGRRSRNRTG